jgi:hypothetical protein
MTNAMKHGILIGLVVLFAWLNVGVSVSQNPLISGQFSADPTARVFHGKIYVYPSHDIPTPIEKAGRKDWFCMEDYHVFSSENLVDWTDHGVIVSQNQVPWVDAYSYSMWAPDCVERNGKYFFYFPAKAAVDSIGKGDFGVGVGVSDKPEGPFSFQPKPIPNLHGIDPCVLIDKDGQAYIYWAQGNLFMAKLKDNMLELDSEPRVIEGLPKGFKEGPFVFERQGKYYLTYPFVKNHTEQLVYSVSDSPMGSFAYGGLIMEESPSACWTNHQSVVQYKDQWYLFYHHNDYSPSFDKNRSICADSLFFEPDGSIRLVSPTRRGVGQTLASAKIQLDRYSAVSSNGVSVNFIDTADTFAGWKILLEKPDAWCSYYAVWFDNVTYRFLTARVFSKTGGLLEVRLDQMDGPIVASLNIPKGASWQNVEGALKNVCSGMHNLFVSLAGNGRVEVDWVSFRPDSILRK